MKKIFLFLIVFLLAVSISNAATTCDPDKLCNHGVEIDGVKFPCSASDDICVNIVLGTENYCENKEDTNCLCTDPDCVTTPATTCKLTSASITPNCQDCKKGDTIQMSGIISGDCSRANKFQINAESSDDMCNIQYSEGDISGINSAVALDADVIIQISKTWSIPQNIPDACLGKTVSASAASLWEGNPGQGTPLATASIVSGSFTFTPTRCTATETSCDDGIDNDCDSEKDWDTYDYRGPEKGDEDCAISITDISAPETANSNSLIEVSCTSSVQNINSLQAFIDSEECTFVEDSWSENTARFTCDAGLAGTKTIKCTINLDKSYQSGADKTTPIIISSAQITECTTGTDCTDNKICIEGKCEVSCEEKYNNGAKCSDDSNAYNSITDRGVCISGPTCYHGEVYKIFNFQLMDDVYKELCSDAQTKNILEAECDSDVLDPLDDPLGYKRDGYCCDGLCILDRSIDENGDCCSSVSCVVGLSCQDGKCATQPTQCSCGSWTNAVCGQSPCSSTEMKQTRTCSPSACQSESQCVSDASCAPQCNQQNCPSPKCCLNNECKTEGTINDQQQACIQGTWQTYVPGECGKLTCNANGCVITGDNTICNNDQACINFKCTSLCTQNSACCFCYSTCLTKVGVSGRAPFTNSDCNPHTLFELSDCR